MYDRSNKSLRRRDAADYLGVPVGTLESWAKRGIGPAYTNPTRGPGGTGGTALYTLKALDAWREGLAKPQVWTSPRRGRKIGSRNKQTRIPAQPQGSGG